MAELSLAARGGSAAWHRDGRGARRSRREEGEYEKDGYFYGRGTIDVKGGAATLAAALLRLRQESFVPDRDLILALTADEEGGDDNGIEWLLANRRDLIDAAYGMNFDTGGGEILGGTLARPRRPGVGEGLRLVHPDGDESRGPQLDAAEGQRDLSARGRADAG